MVVIEGFPFGESLRQVDVVGVAQELVEFLPIRSVRAFDLPVELRRPRLDVDVSNALIVTLQTFPHDQDTTSAEGGPDAREIRENRISRSPLVRPPDNQDLRPAPERSRAQEGRFRITA
jgi:hypothetical protein